MLYKQKLDNTIVKCDLKTVDENEKTNLFYLSPLQLPGSNNYIGTKTQNLHFISGNSVYILKNDPDPDGGFDIVEPKDASNNPVALLHDTELLEISHTDGFLSGGQDPVTKKAVIVKYTMCESFKPDDLSSKFIPHNSTVNFSRVLNYVGSKDDEKKVKYSLKSVVKKGMVNGIKEGRDLKIYADKTPVELANAGGTGRVKTINETFLIEGDYVIIEYQLTLHDKYTNGGVEQECNRDFSFEVIVSKPSCTLFSDDVWFFGQSYGPSVVENNSTTGVPRTSKGLMFKTDKNGKVSAKDYSSESSVDSWENSLSVSTPTCNGDFIFYASHNKVYQYEHTKMTNGDFDGNSSNADGLAAAYLGENKYILVSVSKDAVGYIKYNIVDMNADGGKGDLVKKNIIIDPVAQVAEGIEMIPIVGTHNKYWLLYFRRDTKTIEVLKVKQTKTIRIM